MAPGSAFSILAPFLGRKSKKYEKLETEDPEKKRQEATQEEINRLNCKIERLVHSMSRDDMEKAANPEEQCSVCCQARAVMQVAPCGHQSQCRLCFVQTIQQAVSTRDLPLKCLVCNAKILRVKNNSKHAGGADHPVHAKVPKSVSGYSIGNGNSGMAHSASNYSMSSGVSSMSNSSCGSNRSAKSTLSVRSTASAASWFSIGSLSNFQAGKVTLDSTAFSKPPRAHSLSSCGKSRPKPRNLTTSNSSSSIKSWTSQQNATSPAESKASSSSSKASPDVGNDEQEEEEADRLLLPSPHSIDSRIRAIQGYIRVPMTDADEEQERENRPPKLQQQSKNRLQVTRDNFRRSNSEGGGETKPEPRGIARRSTVGDKTFRGLRYSKSPKSLDVAETTFTMSTIEEEEVTLSLRNLAAADND